MIGKFTKGRVYVFIDAANLENSVKSLGWWVDYKKLAEYFKKEANLVGVRHYCPVLGDKRQDNFIVFLKHAGIKLVTKPLKIITGTDALKGKTRKANFDVEIALDAWRMEDAYDTIILFSGDSDFDYLAKLLHEKKKHIVIVSSKHHISRELMQGCDKYVDLKKLRFAIERIEKRQSPPFSAGS